MSPAHTSDSAGLFSDREIPVKFTTDEYQVLIAAEISSRPGSTKAKEEEVELSTLIEILNERFGTDFKPADQLFLDQVREQAVADEALRQAASANTLENFKYVFGKALEDLFIDRMEQNEEIFARFMNDKDFQKLVEQSLRREVYEQIRGEMAETGGDEAA